MSKLTDYKTRFAKFVESLKKNQQFDKVTDTDKFEFIDRELTMIWAEIENLKQQDSIHHWRC